MTKRAELQTRILEKIGAPLMMAIGEVAQRQSLQGGPQGAAPAAATAAGDMAAEATRMAELLSRTVQVGIGLAGSMDLQNDATQGDSIRLALMAVAGPLVANQYLLSGRVPGEAEVKRMASALEAVLIFADNFSPAAENVMRLEALAPGAGPADSDQVHIQYVSALVPVVNVIAAFPFGRSEKVLLQEVTGTLVKRARAMNAALSQDPASPAAFSRAELSLLQTLAMLYAQAHNMETFRLMAMDEQSRSRVMQAQGGVLSMEPVWALFETRAAMLGILTKAVFAQGGGASSSGGGGPAPQEKSHSPLAAMVEKRAPQTSPETFPQSSPPSSEAAADSEQEGNYNPMAFFKGSPKKAGGAEDAE